MWGGERRLAPLLDAVPVHCGRKGSSLSRNVDRIVDAKSERLVQIAIINGLRS